MSHTEDSDTGSADNYFAVIPEWVIDAASPRALQLYAVLRRHADKKGRSWPSRRTLATRMTTTAKTVDRAAQELVALGALSITHRVSSSGDPDTNLWTLMSLPRDIDVQRGRDTDVQRVGTPMSHRTRAIEPEPLKPDKTATRNLPAVASEHTAMKNAIVAALGKKPSQLTRTAWGAVDRASKDLRAVGATPDEVARRVANWPLLWPGTRPTPSAVAKHWADLEDPQPVPSAKVVAGAVTRARQRHWRNA